MASHPPFLPIIRRIMHSSRRRPFYVVLLLRTYHARRASGVAQGISRRARGESAVLRRYGDLLWDLRLAHTAVPFPQPERQRQYAPYSR